MPAGLGTDGNVMVFSEGEWRFNLKTRNNMAHDTYTVKVIPGNAAEYFIRPPVQGVLVVVA